MEIKVDHYMAENTQCAYVCEFGSGARGVTTKKPAVTYCITNDFESVVFLFMKFT